MFSTDIQLRDWIAQEIRLAMQQEPACEGSLERAGVAEIRAARILSHLDSIYVGTLTTVPKEAINNAINALIHSAG